MAKEKALRVPPPAKPAQLPLPKASSLNGSQKLLFATWAAAIGLSAVRDVAIGHDWPCPGRYIKISALFLILGLVSEVNPSAAKLAATLGVGFTLVFFTREASIEIQKSGTFFGIKVK